MELPPALPPAKRRILRFEPVQLGKVLGILYAMLGLVFVPFFLLMPVIAASLPPEQRGGMVALGAMGLGAAIFVPVMYGVMGFVMGVLGGVLYNLVAKWIGGIEVEVE